MGALRAPLAGDAAAGEGRLWCQADIGESALLSQFTNMLVLNVMVIMSLNNSCLIQVKATQLVAKALADISPCSTKVKVVGNTAHAQHKDTEHHPIDDGCF